MIESAQLVAFLAATDMAAAKAFYGGTLGLKEVSSDPFASMYDCGGTMLRVTAVSERAPAPYTVLGWSVTDIEATIRELVAAGVTFTRYEGMDQDANGVWTTPDGSRVAWFSDPDGNVLSLRSRRSPMALVVGLDGDDTLWHNEKIFSMTEEHFRSLVEPWVGGASLDERLLETERRNLSLFGYGVMSFTLSMIETAIEVSGGRVPTNVIAEILEVGKQMRAHPVELLDGVSETIPALAQRWRLVIVTKGDLFHQESKVARSGLLPHISHVEIVSEKDSDTYRAALARMGVDPSEFVMVGDSVRSDVLPMLDLGARAVHIPGFREWALEQAEVPPDAADRWWSLGSIRELPDLLSSLEQ